MEHNENLHRFQRYYTVLEPWLNKPRVKGYTFLILSIFTSAFFLFFAVRPTLNTIINLRRQISDSMDVDAKLTQKINALSQIQAQYEIIKPDLPLLSQVLPPVSDVAGLVQQMEKTSSDNQLALSAVQFSDVSLVGERQKKDAASGLVPVSFQITEAGDYAKIVNFIESIKKLSRLISIENVNFDSASSSPAATIRMNAYYYQSGKATSQ
ncbi:MAG: type 4a pilus biogenesis protein PilO [Patescibacteria group bacterium]|nr:type 4a pilus biogenesis protein PilO [Patescibacteria group bacterium]